MIESEVFDMLMASILLSALTAFSAEYSSTTLNSIAAGCGQSVQKSATKPQTVSADVDDIEQMANCYEKALEAVPTNKWTQAGLSFATCSGFQNADAEYSCIQKYQGVAQDSELKKVLWYCQDSGPQSLACLKKSKNDYAMETKKEITVQAAQKNYIDLIKTGCGNKYVISSTFIENREVQGLDKCYQMGLEAAQKNILQPGQLALQICDAFPLNYEKVECTKRIIHANYKKTVLDLQPQQKEAISIKEKKAKKERAEALKDTNMRVVDGCMDFASENTKQKKINIKDVEKFYGSAYKCLSENLAKGNIPKTSSAASSDSEGNR